jgi:hypothetical protein
MSRKSRDFYHIQDQLPLAWRNATAPRRIDDSQLEALSRQINDLAKKLVTSNPELSEFMDLSAKKIYLLEQATQGAEPNEKYAREISDEKKQNVEVSLSSSGMGFFSESFAEDDAKVEISLTLDTVDLSVNFSATVLECRLSADSEKPGYWIRVRFAREQDQQIDQLLAHVTQRQIEKLQRNSDSMQNCDGKSAS